MLQRRPEKRPIPSEIHRNTGVKAQKLFPAQISFHRSSGPNIPCDSHRLPDCLWLIVQIDHNSLRVAWRGGGVFKRMIWKGVKWGGWVGVYCLGRVWLVCSLPHHVVIAILNVIAFLAVALNLKRPINGIPGWQKHDPLVNEHVLKCTLMKKTTRSALSNAKKSKSDPIILLCPGCQWGLVTADPKDVCRTTFFIESPVKK